MFFRQVLHHDLGCASYVIADDGVGAVVDPKWEIEEYLELAAEGGFEIRHVLETHNHADHVSGRGRLAAATGATIRVSPTPGLAYPHETLADGESIELGRVRIEALATPGHRPEHTAYVVYDAARGEEPWAVLTGDSLFVGDVARPDLAVDAEAGARGLIAGHTDNQGGAADSQPLSEARVKSVVMWLKGHGVDVKRLDPQGFGATRPVADNATANGRALNRRVEVALAK